MNEEVLFYFDEINIKSIIRDVFRHFWMILVAGISAALLVSGYQNIIYEAEYTSNATLVVSAKGSGAGASYANLTTTAEMAEVFSNVFSSNVLKKRIVEELQLQGAEFVISAQTIPETNLLVLTVSGKQPQVVYQVICGAIDHYADVSEYVFSNAVLDIMETPEVPLYPSNAISLRSYQKKAALAAAVLMGAFLVFMSVMRGTIKTDAAAKRRLNGTKLALIGHEKKNRTWKARIFKKNKSILIINPITTFNYVETFRKLAFRIYSKMKKKGQKILLVSSVGENEGKSTVASNIALAMAQSGKNVTLVDMDMRRPAIYKIFDIETNHVNGFWKDEIFITGRHTMKLYLNKKVIKNPAVFMKEKGVGALLEQEKEWADVIVVDSSPLNAAADTELVLSYMDASILVVRKDLVHVNDLNRAIDVLEKGDTEFLGYVLNDYENRKPVSRSKKRYNYGYDYDYEYGYGTYR